MNDYFAVVNGIHREADRGVLQDRFDEDIALLQHGIDVLPLGDVGRQAFVVLRPAHRHCARCAYVLRPTAFPRWR